MRRTRISTRVFVAAAGIIGCLLSTSVSADTWPDDPIQWAWTCRSSGFYSISALPDGSYKPEADFTGNPQVIINIRQATKDTLQLCNYGYGNDTPALYYAEMQGSGLAKLYNQQGNTCSEATISFTDKTIDKVTGAAGRMMFAVSRDDKDWRFIMSNTDLTTEREGRKLRILAPSPLVNYDAKAEIWMITGQCIMTRAPAAASK